MLLISPALAANHYVWCGAAGAATGADFTNAFTDLPASLTRNDIYYMAGTNSCTYGAHTFNDAVNGTQVISILHVTSTNSAIAGYQSSFSSAPAKWTTATVQGAPNFWLFNQSYYTLDGQIGIVGTTEPISGTFGFWLKKAGDGVNFIWFDGGAGPTAISNIVINHTEIDGSPLNIPDFSSGAAGVFAQGRGTGGNPSSYSNITLQNNYFHDVETTMLQLNTVSNWTVDHSWFARQYYTAGAHGNGVAINPGSPYTEVSSDMTFSFDTWQDICGTQVITILNGIMSNLVVYGNTFFQTTNNMVFPGGTIKFCNGIGQIGDLGNAGAITTGAAIYNNTFVNGTATARSGVAFTNTSSTNIVQKNNLVFNTAYVDFTTGQTGDVESNNTVANSIVSFDFTCAGSGDSCQQTTGITVTTSSVTSNVADVVTTSAHGLSMGSPVVLLGSQVDSATPCGIDTFFPYPTVSQVVSATEIKYTVQNSVPDATCQASVAKLFPSAVDNFFAAPKSKNFTLSSETIIPHLNDGLSLAPPYNLDPTGATRGSDGTWDRGAYEFLLLPIGPAPAPTMFAIKFSNSSVSR